MNVKEQIRNGSFERGNTDFWEVDSADTVLSVQTDQKKRGTYAGLITVTNNIEGIIRTKDYIPVSVYELYKLSAWAKSAVMDQLVIWVLWYDSDFNFITPEQLYSAGGVLASFTEIKAFFRVPEEASYMRFWFYNAHAVADDYVWYLDSISVLRLDIDKTSVNPVDMLTVTNKTVKNTYYGTVIFTGIWKQAEYTLSCTALTGTAPTLDVTIQGYDPTTGLWKDVLVFQQLITAGVEHKTVLSGLGWTQRVKYVTDDTAANLTDCDFIVGAVYKR